MAETVTISTFLELKDNMSAGLKKVEAALGAVSKATKASQRAQASSAERAQKQQERAAQAEAQRIRRLAKMQMDAAALDARLRAKALQGAHNDAVARMRENDRTAQHQIRAARKAAEAQAKIEKSRLGPTYDPSSRSREILRQQQAAAKAAEFAARESQRRKAQSERLANAELKTTQKAQAVASRAAETTSRRKASAELHGINQVNAARNRAHRLELQRAKDEERAHRQSQKETRDLIGKAGASMFGSSAGGIFAAGVASPVAAGALAAIAALEVGVNALKAAASSAFDMTKQFVLKVFEAGTAYQNQIRVMAGTLTAMDAAPTFAIARDQAKKYFTTLEGLAAKLPGETSDYVTVFSQGISQALAQGERDLNRFAEMSSKFTAIAIDKGIPGGVDQAARDIVRIMQGKAIGTTYMFRMMQPLLDKVSGKSMQVADWNKMLPAERMRLFYAALDKGMANMNEGAHDAIAVLGTLNSLITKIFTQGGQPLFQSALGAIETMNAFLTRNLDLINRIVGTISGKLGNLLEGVVTKTMQWAEKLMLVADKFQDVSMFGDGVLGMLVEFSIKMTPIVGQAYDLAKYMADAANSLIQIGLQQDLQRKKDREKEYYKKASAAFGDPKIQAWLQKAPDRSAALLTGETAITRANEAVFKKWAVSGLRGGLDKESWATALQEASGIQVRPELVAKWFAEYEAGQMRTPAAGGKVKGAPKGRQTTINDFRFSKFDIRQEFAEGFDPDRIAVAFASDLARLGEMKMQSAYAPLFAVRGGG